MAKFAFILLAVLALYFLLQPRISQAVTCSITVASDTDLTNANANVVAGQTVCLNSGTYNVQIAPAHSGTSDSQRIIYQPTSGSVTLNQMINLNGKSYITVTGIDVVSSLSSTHYADLSNGSHLTIDTSNMTSGDPHAPRLPPINMTNTSYSVISNSYIQGENNDYEDVIEILGNSYNNLIQNNRMEEGSHTNILIQGDGSQNPVNPPRYNIIRNNHFYNTFHHCINVMYGPTNNVFDGNVFERCGEGVGGPPYPSDDTRTYHDGAGDYGDFHAWESNSIYRRNVIMNSGRDDTDDGASHEVSSTYPVSGNYNLATEVNNHIYQNDYYGNWGEAFRVGVYYRSTGYTGDAYGNNKYINNILYNNYNNSSSVLQVNYAYNNDTGVPSPPDPTGEEWRNNIIGNTGDLSFKWRGTSYAINDPFLPTKMTFTGNLSGDPGFITASRNAGSANFQLQSNAIGVNAGDWLTKTTSACSGNSVTVQDAGYFIDGYGITSGDQVQFAGSSTIYTISSVNYGTNTLTFTTSATCASGVGVAQPYTGSAPDIGAYESSVGGGATPTPTPTPVAGCTQNGNLWNNTSFANQIGPFTVTFDAQVPATGYNAVVGFANGSPSAYTDIAAIARFSTNSTIQAFDNAQGGYSSTTTVPYAANTSYHFRFVIDPSLGTYSVYVTPFGQSEILLASNFKFRTTDTQINDFLAHVDTSINSGNVQVCNLQPPVPATPTPTSIPSATVPPPTPTGPTATPTPAFCY